MGEAKKKRDAGIGPTDPKPAEVAKNWNFERALAALNAHRRPTTPSKPPRQQVINFCGSVSSLKPVYLPFTNISPDYGSGWCHNNVLEQIRRAGGKRVNGWMIWDNGKFVEGEFHSVWESPDGQLVDLTPRADREAEILFLPDAVMKITNDGTADYFPNNRTSIAECPYSHRGLPLQDPMARREYTPAQSPFGFASVA